MNIPVFYKKNYKHILFLEKNNFYAIFQAHKSYLVFGGSRSPKENQAMGGEKACSKKKIGKKKKTKKRKIGKYSTLPAHSLEGGELNA